MDERKCTECKYYYDAQGKKTLCAQRRKEFGIPSTFCFDVRQDRRRFWEPLIPIPEVSTQQSPSTTATTLSYLSEEGALILDHIARLQDGTRAMAGAY